MVKRRILGSDGNLVNDTVNSLDEIIRIHVIHIQLLYKKVENN